MGGLASGAKNPKFLIAFCLHSPECGYNNYINIIIIIIIIITVIIIIIIIIIIILIHLSYSKCEVHHIQSERAMACLNILYINYLSQIDKE